MSDNAIALPVHATELIDEPEADTSLYLVTANGENGLQTEVVDVRGKVPAAFPPRAPERRTVTDTASFLAEVTRRPLLQGLSTVWGNRDKGQVSVIYNELGTDATADYTRRNDVLTLQFVADPDWATLFNAADGRFHTQLEFGDLIEQAGHLITSHQAADVMEIVDSIRASSKGSFESGIKRATSSVNLTYSEEVSAKAGTATRQLEVPREITLSARPFEDYPVIEVRCWLRLNISQGQLGLGLFPQPYQHLVRDAWTHVTGELSEALGVPVYAANLGK
ncbi:DUF2303 family protein [Mycobacteroides abscessus]|uniref:DUF2303 family protein n=1 Tax=Mycobacteroides abscessus TaxID=36809 RepID=UPI00092CD993|nr:DUF2303 family protein [Mycobacteroides abscessus]QST90598.1 hypothetical protein PROPHIGD52-1_12 [Mycobacterium phage prophi52-1]MBN7332423.1 DUF2303 family protein [Mycobacteroides abscessus subsp. abscessus]SHX23020.1 Uncharacterized conserved protein [Mycobacteroides abscessus subsp. abscessus]SIA44225.1 Uncharacterized conserved protein [Mycobacteroides abscessus subsp. abscessus]SIA77562.1 Uncharacterized conserved protein [Mycobacteroides abscessus subsp. abscessus]